MIFVNLTYNKIIIFKSLNILIFIRYLLFFIKVYKSIYKLRGDMLIFQAHQKIGLIEKISPIKLYTKVKKSIEKNTNIRYNLIDEN